jgi:hypothetical protein
MADAERKLTSRVGPIEVDWPRSLGYYGGIGAAIAIGMIEWPVAVFIGAIPFVNLFQKGSLPLPFRFAAQVFDGAAKPVGGDSEGTIRAVRTPPRPKATSTTERATRPTRATPVRRQRTSTRERPDTTGDASTTPARRSRSKGTGSTTS